MTCTGKWISEGIHDPVFGFSMCIAEDMDFYDANPDACGAVPMRFDEFASAVDRNMSRLGSSMSRALSAWTLRPLAPSINQVTSCVGDDTSQCMIFVIMIV